MDCLDCKNCKCILSKGIVRCKTGLWKRDGGEEKVFKLRAREVKTAHIEWRNVFSQGKNCPDFKLWEK